VGHPSGGGGGELLPEIAADVEVACAGASAKPLDAAADGEIHVERADVDGEGSGGLVEIGADHCARFVGALDDGGDVLHVGAAEGDLGDGDERGGVVDRGEDVFDGEGETVG